MRSSDWSRELLSICIFISIVLIILSLLFLARFIGTSSPPPKYNEASLITAMQGYNYAKNVALSQYKDCKLVGIDNFCGWNDPPAINGTCYSWYYYFVTASDDKYILIRADNSVTPIPVVFDISPSPEGLHELQGIYPDTDWKCDSDAATMTAMSLYHNITGIDPMYFRYELINSKNSTTGNFDFYWNISLFGDYYQFLQNGTKYNNYSNTLFAYIDAKTGALLYYNYINYYLTGYQNLFASVDANTEIDAITEINALRNNSNIIGALQYYLNNSNNASEAIEAFENYWNNTTN